MLNKPGAAGADAEQSYAMGISLGALGRRCGSHRQTAPHLEWQGIGEWAACVIRRLAIRDYIEIDSRGVIGRIGAAATGKVATVMAQARAHAASSLVAGGPRVGRRGHRATVDEAAAARTPIDVTASK